MPTPIFNINFTSPHRPAVSSPLSSSPLRPSQSDGNSSPPLSPRHPNTLPRRDIQSSPIRGPPQSKFKYASRNPKPNPLRQSRENMQDSRRKLFLKNVRQRADDKTWQRRGGDQEALKLEWSLLDRRRREMKNSDIDGLVFEDEIDDIPELHAEAPGPAQEADEMMVDAVMQEEEQELEAMLSMLEAQSSSQVPARPDMPSLSDDDDYDSIFMDLLSQQQQRSSSPDLVLSGHMDIS
ncbi:hypothetical protein DL768_001294 [Monosporascus sp. mg162]|nr:hypothetical protein DL768_001294 [Monosporascus sp. mg162]